MILPHWHWRWLEAAAQRRRAGGAPAPADPRVEDHAAMLLPRARRARFPSPGYQRAIRSPCRWCDRPTTGWRGGARARDWAVRLARRGSSAARGIDDGSRRESLVPPDDLGIDIVVGLRASRPDPGCDRVALIRE